MQKPIEHSLGWGGLISLLLKSKKMWIGSTSYAGEGRNGYIWGKHYGSAGIGVFRNTDATLSMFKDFEVS